MDGYEKCSLVALFIAYIVVILLITIHEVTECQMSRIKQILNIGNCSIISNSIIDNLVHLLCSYSFVSLP